jgi:hypothetical protein
VIETPLLGLEELTVSVRVVEIVTLRHPDQPDSTEVCVAHLAFAFTQ